LFAAWLDLANIQSEFDVSPASYAPTGVPRLLSDARRQLHDDFKLACRMLPEHFGRSDTVSAAEKILINNMVQLSRSKILVREMDFHKMCNKSMEKVREFCTKQAHKEGPRPPMTRGETMRQAELTQSGASTSGGHYSGGRGKGGKGGKNGGRGVTCFNCQMVGHPARLCPFPPGASRQEQWQQWPAAPVSTPLFQPGQPPAPPKRE
jgi:hypothetical protein